MTYPAPVENPTEIRYTTLAAVKRQIGINDAAWDSEVTQAIIALETMMDVWMERSYEDPVPEQVSQAALVGGCEIFKLADGTMQGSDADGFIGMLDPASAARAGFGVAKTLLVGTKVAWGTAA